MGKKRRILTNPGLSTKVALSQQAGVEKNTVKS